ncbi:MAG: FUSC family protein, partial [Rhodanobacter sp.]
MRCPCVPAPGRDGPVRPRAPFDHGLLLFSSVSAAAATFCACMLWIQSGWEPGAGAVILVAVASCFFAAIDDPRPQLNAFLQWVVIGSAFALIYLFAILPQVHTFLGL